MVRALIRDEPIKPRWSTERRRVPRDVWLALREARELSTSAPGGALYLARLEELELELTLMEVLGAPRQVRPMAARRYGTGEREVRLAGRDVRLRDVAAELLDEVEGAPEEPTVPARGPGSLSAMMQTTARLAGLEIRVCVDARLVANAAAGDRTVYLADRRFGAREAVRLAVHEVLGHLVAAANGRAQRLALLAVGTAGSFADQEGLALHLEEHARLLDGRRVRTLAARVWVTDRLQAGAPFDDTVRRLVREHEFTPDEAIALGERAYRGGGMARDAGYLFGWLRVREAVASGETSVDELRLGKVGVDDVPALRELMARGEVREAAHRPRLQPVLDALGDVPVETGTLAALS